MVHEEKRLRRLNNQSNSQEITQLIENGFEYITEQDGIKYFRKRK